MGSERGGTEQGRRTPEGETTSTDVAAELMGNPPVISSTKIKDMMMT